MTANKGWDAYLKDVRWYIESGRLYPEEVKYKLDIAKQLREARRAVLAGEENCLDLVSDALHDDSNNLISWREDVSIREWCASDPDAAIATLRAFWSDRELPAGDRILAITRILPSSVLQGTGTRLKVISVLLMAVDAHRFPVFKITEYKNTLKRIGLSVLPTPSKSDEASLYDHFLWFLDELIKRARKIGLEQPADRLEAQSVYWVLSRPCWFVGANWVSIGIEN